LSLSYCKSAESWYLAKETVYLTVSWYGSRSVPWLDSACERCRVFNLLAGKMKTGLMVLSTPETYIGRPQAPPMCKQGRADFCLGSADSEAVLHATSGLSGANRWLVIMERLILNSNWVRLWGILGGKCGEHLYADIFLSFRSLCGKQARSDKD